MGLRAAVRCSRNTSRTALILRVADLAPVGAHRGSRMHADPITRPRTGGHLTTDPARAWLAPGPGSAPRPIRPSFLDLLDTTAQLDLETLGSLRVVATGQVAFLQGEHPARVALVVSGLLKLTSADDGGHTVFLGLRRPGDLIGLTELLDGQARSSSATSIGRSTVRMIGATDFQAFIDRSRSVLPAMSRTLAAQVRDSVTHRLRMAHAVPTRLADQLLELAADHGSALDDGTLLIDLPVTQDDLAMMIDASRDSVAKTLMQWRRQRIVETARRRITIVDPGRLATSS